MNKEPIKKNKYHLKVNIYLEHALFQSDAFKKLSAKEIFILLRFLQKRPWKKDKKRRGKPVYDNKGIAFTYDEANCLGISTSKFCDGIKKLVSVGFLDVAHQGGPYGRDYSRYNISDRWRSYGTPLFQTVVKKRVLQQGLDVQSHIRRKLKYATEISSE
jgi:hypothetical protein